MKFTLRSEFPTLAILSPKRLKIEFDKKLMAFKKYGLIIFFGKLKTKNMRNVGKVVLEQISRQIQNCFWNSVIASLLDRSVK